MKGDRDQSVNDLKKKKKDLLSMFLDGHLGARVRFYELAGNHKLDETHVECDFCLTMITYHVRHFHLKLTSAGINNCCHSKPS